MPSFEEESLEEEDSRLAIPSFDEEESLEDEPPPEEPEPE
jgi:hypothetical protein